MADFTRNGYGQVEPNQLSAQKTGQIYASLPLDDDVAVLQNGEFMFYDYKSGTVSADDSTGVAEPMLVFNEIKLYEPFWRTSYKDFAMIRVGDNSLLQQVMVMVQLPLVLFLQQLTPLAQLIQQVIQNIHIEWMELHLVFSRQM